MRDFPTLLAALALASASCLAGSVHVQLLPANSTVPAAGGTVTITIQVLGDELTQADVDAGDAGDIGPMAVSGLVGSIEASGTVTGASSSDFAYVPGVWAGLHADDWNTLPTPLENGALSVFGAQQNTPFADSNTVTYGLGQWVDFATFTLTIPIGQAGKSLTLSFVQDDTFTANQALASLLVSQWTMSPVHQTPATINIAVDPQDPEDPQGPEDPQDPQDPGTPQDPTLPQDPEDPQDPETPQDPDQPQMNVLLAMVVDWGTSLGGVDYDPVADLNHDSRVDVFDLLALALSLPDEAADGPGATVPASSDAAAFTLLVAILAVALAISLMFWIFFAVWR